MTYTIKDISEMFNISIYTIRFYDKEGLLPFILRNSAGNRVFTESDVNLFKLIYCLKSTGMKIKDIRKYIDFCMEGISTMDIQKKLLLDHQETIIQQIHTLNENLKLIKSKIESYEIPNAEAVLAEKRANLYKEKYLNNLL